MKPKITALRNSGMADSDAEFAADQTPAERAARYWKKAEQAYHQACNAEAPEVRQFYIKLAMAMSALAVELERVPDHGHVEAYRYDSINDRSPRM